MSIAGINPNDLGNMGEIEQQFAVKTVEYLEVSLWNRVHLFAIMTDLPPRQSHWVARFMKRFSSALLPPS